MILKLPWVPKHCYHQMVASNPPSRECVCVCQSLSRIRLFTTLWTVAHQTPLSMGFSRQEYWSGEPFPSPGDLPKPGIESRSPALWQILYHLNHQGSPHMHKDQPQ